jgi:glycosyltransferase involved in cell wall biosynthesis
LQPDEFVLDAPAFARAILATIRSVKAEGLVPVVVACSPPWSTTIAARWAAWRGDAPLILDLQDLWSENPVARWPHLSRHLAAHLERQAFAAASGFIFINERIATRYAALHPGIAGRPSAIAHIGSEHPPTTAMRLGGGAALELLYVGSIYRDRDLAPLLDACIKLRTEGYDVRLVWHGSILGVHPMRSRLNAYRDAGVLVMRGAIPHAEARERMRHADLLVTVPSPVYEEELTGKLFDYIDAGRPILALARPTSFLAEVIRRAGIGETIDPSDDAEILSYLRRVVTRGASYYPRESVLADFTPEAMGAALAHVTERIC